VVDDLSISRAQYGVLLTVPTAFAAVLSTRAGGLVDMFGARIGMVVIFLACIASEVSVGLTSGYVALLLCASISSVGGALANPVTNQLIAGLVVHERQAVVMGVKQSGVQLAPLIAGAILPTGAAAFGWRAVLGASALIPLIGLVAGLALVRRAPAAPRQRRSERRPAGAWVRGLTLYALLMGFGAACMQTYLPLYAVQHAHFSTAEAGAAAAVMGVAAIGARIGWARGSEDPSRAARTLLMLSVGGAAGIALVAGVDELGSATIWIGAAAFGMTATAWNAVANLTILRRVPRGMAGRVSGTMQAGFYAGLATAPISFGAIVDSTGTYTYAWLVAVAVVLAAAATTRLATWGLPATATDGEDHPDG
jgi:predicted MFS family arabinose efflux permease